MTIYCDVDGTLTHKQDGPKPWPVWQENINALKKLIDDGHTVIVWSCRGERAAYNFCYDNGIHALALSKPDMCFDDEPSLHDDPRVMEGIDPSLMTDFARNL